jgi:hypothetical protein
MQRSKQRARRNGYSIPSSARARSVGGDGDVISLVLRNHPEYL